MLTMLNALLRQPMQWNVPMQGWLRNNAYGPRPSPKIELALGLAALLLAGGSYFAWCKLSTPSLPAGIAKANGRIEAERVDVATKLAGRLKQVLVKEGDSVTAGQMLALMDTAELDAQLNDAKATARQADRQLDQAIALLAQRKSELTLSDQELDRAEKLAAKGYTSRQVVEQRTSAKLTAVAAVNSAQAQIDVAKASIESATARVARSKPIWMIACSPRRGQAACNIALRCRARCWPLEARSSPC